MSREIKIELVILALFFVGLFGSINFAIKRHNARKVLQVVASTDQAQKVLVIQTGNIVRCFSQGREWTGRTDGQCYESDKQINDINGVDCKDHSSGSMMIVTGTNGATFWAPVCRLVDDYEASVWPVTK